MNEDEYKKSGAAGHYDPVTDSYYTEVQYAELMASRAAAEAAPVVAEKPAKTKTAEPAAIKEPVTITPAKD